MLLFYRSEKKNLRIFKPNDCLSKILRKIFLKIQGITRHFFFTSEINEQKFYQEHKKAVKASN